MSGKVQGDAFKQEDVLQAVVIADSFNVRFAPITRDRPRALLPLANVALLDYTLEFLCTAGIQEVIVFCCHLADQIKEHLLNSKWTSKSSPCEIRTVISEGCLSIGDALREIDSLSLIKSDFVLVNGDMVANLVLKDIITQHKERRLKEKTPIMTMVFARALPGHRTRCQEDDVILAIQPSNNRILHYQKAGHSRKFTFPLEIFHDHSNVQLRYDLLDCHINVCSPQVPQLFTDEFDYQTREDFVRGILVNEEILGNTIHVHVMEGEYASRVTNLQMYEAISKDVCRRWSYPLVPDCNITNQPEGVYSHRRHNIYLHKDITLARGCVLHQSVVIGQGSRVGSNTHISHSIIGRNCTIGENVKIEGAYIWDNVTIDDNCSLSTCLLAERVHLLNDVSIKPGCVLSTGVKVGPDITLSSGTKLMATPPDGDSDFGDDDAQITPAEIERGLVGSGGQAYVYRPAADDSDEDVDDLVHEMWGVSLHSDEEESDVSSVDSESRDEDSLPASPPPEDSKMFYEEVQSTLQRAIEENLANDNMVLEINSLKSAYAIHITEVNTLVTRALVELPLKDNPTLEASQYLLKYKTLMKRFLPLLKNYIKSISSQKDCLYSIEEACLSSGVIGSTLVKILHLLYESDLLTEESIMHWHQHIPEEAEDILERRNLRKQVAPLIKWLQEAEEESDSEEDDDED